MTIYQTLQKYKKRRPLFENSEEFSFFVKNRELLRHVPRFEFLSNTEDDEFNIIRANIIINSYFNKKTIETEISNLSNEYDLNKLEKGRLLNILKERLSDLPYMIYNNSKIYVPIFSLPVNLIYSKDPEKLLTYPYSLLKSDYYESVIDPFDVYGPSLFDSYFTRLVNVCDNGKEVGFFNYDTNTIYIVNCQGRLDVKIVLFDKYIKHPMTNHMLERLRPVVEAYFNNNRQQFVDALYDNNFISLKMHSMLCQDNNK